MHWDIPGLWGKLGGTPEPPQKMFPSENLRLPKVQLVFSLGILEGAKRQTSRAAYNGPKQQCYVKRQKQISPKNGGRNFV